MITRASSTQHLCLLGLSHDDVTRLNISLAVLMLASFVVFLPAMVVDPRSLDGAGVWVKPQKFNLSLALPFLTIATLAQLLPFEVRNGRALRVATYFAAVALIFEFLWVGFQAAHGKRSHFNFDTTFESIMYALMGVGALLLMVIALVLCIQILRRGDRSRFGLWLGAVVGLGLAFISTLFIGFEMSSTSRYVGASLEGGGATVPFFGWSREYGDLRPSHFVSLHLMQTLPFLGWLSDKRGWRAKQVVGTAAVAQLGLAIFLFQQAKAGLPIWPI